jgi:glucokinase
MSERMLLGIDMGGTWLRGALVSNGRLVPGGVIAFHPIDKLNSFGEIWETLCHLIDGLLNGNAVGAIGIGVPGLVEPGSGIIYDVLNIQSWKDFPLQTRLEERFRLPVFIGNDANCFAWGEYISGKGRDADSLIGLTIGTGLGAGIILNGKLYTGASGAAGEFGMVDYLGRNYEYYASGSFFRNVHGLDGRTVFERAGKGDAAALQIYSEFGAHLGNAIKMILCTFDPDLIVLGGSVTKAWPFFSDAMRQSLAGLAFSRSLRKLKIEVSELENAGIIGAAALCDCGQ